MPRHRLCVAARTRQLARACLSLEIPSALAKFESGEFDDHPRRREQWGASQHQAARMYRAEDSEMINPMTTKNGTAGRQALADDNPPLTLSTADEERLSGLATMSARRNAEVAELLLEEIGRAQLVPADQMPEGVVRMHAYVEYRDEATGAVRRVQLVYPHEADIAQGSISVLTLVGAGLLGLAAGQSIMWPTQDGRERRLTVLRVSPEPFESES
nr:nucleoside diphosphate kinase regulator [Limobrevibacterium gyesilva]